MDGPAVAQKVGVIFTLHISPSVSLDLVGVPRLLLTPRFSGARLYILG